MAKKNSQDNIILKLQEKIKEKKAILEKSAKPVYESKCVINIPGASLINIHTLNEETGISALAGLISYKAALEQAIKIVPGCTKTTSEVDMWMRDILLKLETSNRNNLIASLKKDEKDLEELLSDDYKKDKKLTSILEKYA